MKKILFIVTQSEFGGTQRYVFEVATSLNLQEYDVLVAAGQGNGELFQKLKIPETRSLELEHLRRTPWPHQIIFSIFEIFNLLKKERPDVLFLCSTTAGLLGSVASAIYKSRYTRMELASQDTQINAENEFLYPEITYKIRGACFKVWKQFRGAFKEKAVERAFIKELENQGLKADAQKQIPIVYGDEKIGFYVPDVIVNNKVLIELKRKPFLTKEDEKQFWLYLKGSEYRLGLLINFGRKLEIKRRIYDKARENTYPRVSAYPEGQNLRRSASKLKVIYRIGGWAFRDPRPCWQNKIILWAEKITAPLKDKIIVNSEIDRKEAIRYKIASPEKIIKIYNGIDINSLNFLPKDEARKSLSQILNLKPETLNLVVGTVANFYKTKGLPYLIEAAHILNSKYKIFNTKYLIIGEGKERPKIKALIKKYNLENQVFLIGRISDAYKYLRAFDVFILPSLKEGFPWIILEVMAAEVPIVATGVGAIPEIIENGKSGFLIKPKDSQNLAEKVKEVILNPKLKKQFINSAEERLKEFTKEKMLQKTKEILEN